VSLQVILFDGVHDKNSCDEILYGLTASWGNGNNEWDWEGNVNKT